MTHSLLDSKKRCTQLIQYWKSLPKGPGGIPYRKDFDHNQLTHLIPSMFIAEKTDTDTVLRVTGSRLSQRQPNTPVLERTPLETLFHINSRFLLRVTLDTLQKTPAFAELDITCGSHTGAGVILPLYTTQEDSPLSNRFVGLLDVPTSLAPIHIKKSTQTDITLSKTADIARITPADLAKRSKATKHSHLRIVTK